MEAQAVEWWQFDWEYASSPVRTSSAQVRKRDVNFTIRSEARKSLPS